MEHLIRWAKQSSFIRHNAIFFVGSLSIGFLNYLYYPVLGRLLAPNAFGEVQVLASLLAQISIFLGVLSLITVNIVTNYEGAEKRNRIIIELERLAVIIGIGMVALAVLGGTALKHFFKFDSPAPFAILTLAVAVTIPLTFRLAYLRAKLRFGIVSWIGIIASAADLVFAAAFVRFGWSTTGVMVALVLGQGLACIIAAFSAKHHGFSESLHGMFVRLPDVRLILPELKYAGLVLVGSLTITGMYSIDTIIVKHYFDAHTAGLYAGISTIARIIFFLTASIIQVMLPTIKLQQSMAENRRMLIKSFALFIAIGGGALAAFILLPKVIIQTLMGKTYLPYAHILPQLSLVIFIVSLLNLFITYYLALRRYEIGLVVVAGFIITLFIVRFNHGSLDAVVSSLLYGSLAMFALLGGWTAIGRLKKLQD